MRRRMAKAVALCAVFLAAYATPSSAQVSTGRIDATIADSSGAVLPGVDGRHQRTAEPVGGQRCNGRSALPEPGRPALTPSRAKLSGFSEYINKNVIVAIGTSVPLNI